MKFIRPIWVETPWMPWANAMVLWPFVLRRRGIRRDAALEAHEHFHWYQALKWGVLPWYALYGILALIYRTGGRRHPLERPAYELADRIREGRNG